MRKRNCGSPEPERRSERLKGRLARDHVDGDDNGRYHLRSNIHQAVRFADTMELQFMKDKERRRAFTFVCRRYERVRAKSTSDGGSLSDSDSSSTDGNEKEGVSAPSYRVAKKGELSLSSSQSKKRRWGLGESAFAVDTNVNFSEIGGLDANLLSVKEVVMLPMRYPEIFAQFGVTPPRGILFYGPPGTGKTMLARALCNMCNSSNRRIKFFMCKGSECFRKYLGDTEKCLRDLFQSAYESRPSIIFFDELDALAPARSSKHEVAYNSAVSTLLALMDGVDSRGEVIVIGATNRLDMLDPALRRPGRFDREIRFSLPDTSARRDICQKITSLGTAKKLSDEDLDWLAEQTSGYSGADLKMLYSEALYMALRSGFPQIYASNNALEVDPRNVAICRDHFTAVMKHMVPASRRDFTVPSYRLDENVAKLLMDDVKRILEERVPQAYRTRQLQEDRGELEKVLRSVDDKSRAVIATARVLVCGSSSQMGQTSHVLPAVLAALDHHPVISLAVTNIFSCGLPGSRLAELLQSAVRTARGGTACILLIPSIDLWEKSFPPDIWTQLELSLRALSPFTPVLLLASAECAYDVLSEKIKALFSEKSACAIEAPPVDRRRRYFEGIMSAALQEPGLFNPAEFPTLPEKRANADASHYSEDQIQRMKADYQRARCQLNLHYLNDLSRFMRDSRFKPFAQPVNEADVPDYSEIIEHPMDLYTMTERVGHYKTPDEYLADFELIYANAAKYNSTDEQSGRSLIASAKVLRECGRQSFLSIDQRFVNEMERMKSVLSANGIDVGYREVKLEHGTFEEASKFGSEVEVIKTLPVRSVVSRRGNRTSKRTQKSSNTADAGEGHSATSRDALNAPNKRARFASDKHSSGGKGGRAVEEAVPEAKENDGNMDGPLLLNTMQPRYLTIDESEMRGVVRKAVAKTDGWPVEELESLAAVLMEAISAERDSWDRRGLPKQLNKLIDCWKSLEKPARACGQSDTEEDAADAPKSKRATAGESSQKTPHGDLKSKKSSEGGGWKRVSAGDSKRTSRVKGT